MEVSIVSARGFPEPTTVVVRASRLLAICHGVFDLDLVLLSGQGLIKMITKRPTFIDVSGVFSCSAVIFQLFRRAYKLELALSSYLKTSFRFNCFNRKVKIRKMYHLTTLQKVVVSDLGECWIVDLR